jgi:hypothetical protein
MPKIAIDGVICRSPGGSMGARGPWYLVIELSPWRHPDGHIEKQELRVEQRVGTDKALDRAMAKLDEGMSVRVTARGVTPPGRGLRWWNAAGVSRIARTARAPGLDDARRELARPVVVRDATLGRLALDRQFDAFVGKRRLGGRRYELSIARAPRGEPADQVSAARPRVAAFESALPRILDAVTTKLLRLYNTAWRERGPALQRDAFVRRLRLTSAHVAPRRTTLYLDAGTLFAGHIVEVRLGPRGNVREVMLAG